MTSLSDSALKCRPGGSQDRPWRTTRAFIQSELKTQCWLKGVSGCAAAAAAAALLAPVSWLRHVHWPTWAQHKPLKNRQNAVWPICLQICTKGSGWKSNASPVSVSALVLIKLQGLFSSIVGFSHQHLIIFFPSNQTHFSSVCNCCRRITSTTFATALKKNLLVGSCSSEAVRCALFLFFYVRVRNCRDPVSL